MSQVSDSSPQLEKTDSNNSSNEPSLLNKIFRRRSSQNSRKSMDEQQVHNESFMQYLTPHKTHSRHNSSNNPCYRLSFQVGVAENKNTKFRPTMEDVHTYVANFAERLDWGYFAIFDGHAGKQTARWCGSNLHSIIEVNILKNDTQDLRSHLNHSFIQSDERILEECSGSSGSTAAVAVLRWEEIDIGSPTRTKGQRNHHRSTVDPYSTPFDFVPTQHHKRMLYTANVGDSRLVLSRGGKLLRLSYDHKGSDINEQERIINSGGVVMKSRVNGMLAVTRSLGDTYMKDLVIGNPYTTATEITDLDEFLIIACDGLWDVCSDQKAVDLIREIKDVNKAANVLCNYAIENMTTDNITVMVVRFDNSVFKFKSAQGKNTDDDNDLAVVDDEITISNSTRLSDEEKTVDDSKHIDVDDKNNKSNSVEVDVDNKSKNERAGVNDNNKNNNNNNNDDDDDKHKDTNNKNSQTTILDAKHNITNLVDKLSMDDSK